MTDVWADPRLQQRQCTYHICRNEDSEISITVIQHPPNHGTDEYSQSDTHSRKAHGGSSSLLADRIG